MNERDEPMALIQVMCRVRPGGPWGGARRRGGGMAEITRKRQGEMLRTVFEILLGQPEGLPAREVLAKAEDRLGLTEFEASDYPSRPGVRRWEKTVRFATIGPVKAGWP